MRSLPLMLVLAVACRTPTTEDTALPEQDADGDGVFESADCDDNNPDIYPGAAELCNDLDDDCDLEVDEEAIDPTTFYLDGDGDGFGEDPVEGCKAPEGAVADAGDCDDDDAAYYPGAPEEDCTDPNDYNCDGSSGFEDADTDGVPACEDCDDSNPALSPNAVELCDDIDNNCDGNVDEGGAAGERTWYIDSDGDGYGSDFETLEACGQPDGFVDNDDDCVDDDAIINPDGIESCNAIDDDCDGVVDDNAVDPTVFHRDADDDGFGDPDATFEGCTAPDGYVLDASDCNDLNPSSYPDATEICDLEDNNCDGTVDEDAVGLGTFYADADGDGFGDTNDVTQACGRPEGTTPLPGDCDDTRRRANPLADERCNGLDDDCDEEVDEEAIDASTFYADTDGDGFGDEDAPVRACEAGDGEVDNDEDCDDTAETVNPGVSETCNEVDDDCDGDVDEGVSDAPLWYLDADDDGVGGSLVQTRACAAPTGYVDSRDDCNDLNPNSYPGAEEVCDGADNDCDEEIDEGAAEPAVWYADSDGDGFGLDDDAIAQCSKPSGYVATPGDCDDTKPSVRPNTDELCNGYDDDCDGGIDIDPTDGSTFYVDADGDGRGSTDDTRYACSAPDGFVGSDDDCDDNDAQTYPQADELCDPQDRNCNGQPRDNAVDVETFYADGDGDGYGTTSTTEACTKPNGYADADGDCNDSVGSVNPGATETWYDGTDQDCSGGSDYDQDGDGAESYAEAGGKDCNDTDPDLIACGSDPNAPGETCATVHDADDSLGDGLFWLDPDGNGAFEAWCDMSTDGGGWTVFQRREDGSEQFYRNWADYKNGFGTPEAEHWLGNDKIHRLTAAGANELRVDMTRRNGDSRFAKYSTFSVGNESTGYVSNFGGFSGNVPDCAGGGSGMYYHSGVEFSTYDQNRSSCADSFRGGWWYRSCHYNNPNGQYLNGAHGSYADGVNWYCYTGYYESLTFFEMKAR